MPWCPKCGAEYYEGAAVCSTCNIPLQRAPTLREADGEEADWVIILRSTNEYDIQSARDLLEDNGIPSMLRPRGEAIQNLYGRMQGDEDELYVKLDNFETASKLLAGRKEWTEEDLADYMERTGELEKEDDEGEQVDVEGGELIDL